MALGSDASVQMSGAMSWVDFWPGRYELPKKLASLEQDEIGPQASDRAPSIDFLEPRSPCRILYVKTYNMIFNDIHYFKHYIYM